MTVQNVTNEIKKIINEIFIAFEEHKPEGIEKHMHPNVTIWDVFTPQLIRGQKERDKFHADDQEQMQARGPLQLSIEDPVIDSWNEVVIARYYLNFVYLPPNATQGRVRITDVFRKVGAHWLIVHHHEGIVPEGIPSISEKK